MNAGNEQFERDFEAFLHEDDSRLSALYRKLPATEPDARLDAAVRAMAQRAMIAKAPARMPAQRRWMPAFGIAAVLALAAGIGLRLAPGLWQRSPGASPAAPAAPIAQGMPTQPSEPATTAMQEAAAQAATEAARAPAPEPQRREDSTPPPMPRALPAPAPAVRPLLKPEPTAAPQAASPALASPTLAHSPKDKAVEQTAGAIAMPESRRAAKPMSAPPAAMEATDANASLYPEHWLANIRQMLRDGKRDEALRSLALFRKQHPGYRLPDDLRDLH
ncbi:MAG: hypothetical protein JSS28_11185 [Proteobacteria bacterium]|nr:hypothetical protein [Pseudomonadota bacterium]